MSKLAWCNVCEPEVSTVLPGNVFSGAMTLSAPSPIDDYYAYVEHVLTLGGASELAASPTLGRLLLLGLVGGVETYFRTVIAGVLRLCPIARKEAAGQMLPFGAVDYYGVAEIELGLFDTASLAGASEIRKKTQALLGIGFQQGTSVYVALDEFNKVCHLRHAAAHARGTLSHGNASALELGAMTGRRALDVSFANLQTAGLVCHSAVRAYNRAVYEQVVQRWIDKRLLRGTWTADKALFQPMFEMFRSQKDKVAPANAYRAYQLLTKVRPALAGGGS